MSFFYDERDEKFRAGRIIAAFILLMILVAGASYGIRWLTAPAEGSLEARERIQGEGEFRIAAYEHFFDLCSSIQGAEGQIEALTAELQAATDPERINQIQVSLTGLNGERLRSIAKYNADAAKDYTVGQFRDADLPFKLDPDEETVCVL